MQHYDQKARMREYHVGDRVFVHMPGEVRVKAWNASVRLVDRPQDTPIFVSLDRVRRCPEEIPNGKTWSKKKRNRKRRTGNTRKFAPEMETQEPVAGPWSDRLRPRRGRR